MTEWGNEDLDVDFSRIYEIAKRDDLVEIEEFRPYKNTKRFTENLINDLCQSTEKYEVRKTIQELERYIKESDRLEEFFYSDVSHYIFELGVSEKKNLHENVKLLLMYILKDENNVDKNIKQIALKIYDYINLNKVQNENIKNILQESVVSVKGKLHDEIKNIEREYITILGIFASIVLSFVGGITFTTSVLQNIDKVSMYRLVLMIDFIGFILVNVMYILISFILEINDINKRRYNKYIKCINRVLLAVACLIILSWFFDIIGIQKYISRCFFWLK